MSIRFFDEERVFKLDTVSTSYLIGISDVEGFLGHVYYGSKVGDHRLSYLLRTEEAPFVPSVNVRERNSFLDAFPMEFSTHGVGDFRESCLRVLDEGGHCGCGIFYESHRIFKGKEGLEGLPATFGDVEDCESLEITCVDPVLSLEVVLSYTTFDREDVIARSVRVTNRSTKPIFLNKVFSACLDMDNEDFQMISLHGSWARERQIQRCDLAFGKQCVSSLKGESSHQEHPFLALVTPETTQDVGKVYGMNFVYSGNFIAQTELTQFDRVRVVMGIHSEGFSWRLNEGECFQAPEVILTFSDEGLGKMTRSYHDLYRNHLMRSSFTHKKRPILINNWEATYFDFNTEKLLDIAKDAADCGIEMLVMDDGWFGHRSSDDSSLGDWYVNEDKITGGLPYLVDEVKKLGLKFGIWFEPEMISPDSQLYQNHPDWAIQIQGRQPAQSRAQFVLDLSRQEVIDYVYEQVAGILRSADIAYVKWDMNRQLCDLGSSYLEPACQGELYHRFVLGVYQLQQRLVDEFPDLLLENCSGGGARFDPGMLFYSPQIWCSDDTDAIERLSIQEGTALIYPLSSIGAHVSVCPNHTVGRNTPFETRGHVALAGTFGYELDITKLTEAEKVLVKQQTADYHKYQPLVREGDYYRIASWKDNHSFDCYGVVSKDKTEALFTYVQVLARANVKSRKIFLKGLDPDRRYLLEYDGKEYDGDVLMKVGILMDQVFGDFRSCLLHFKSV